MNFAEEKEEIVKRIYREEDATVIFAIKELLDTREPVVDHDAALERALSSAIQQSENGEGRPHEEVWAEICKRYKR